MLDLGAVVVPRPTAALKRIAAVRSFELVAAAAARRRSRCWMSAACTALVSLSSGAEPASVMLDGAHGVGVAAGVPVAVDPRAPAATFGLVLGAIGR